MFFTDSVKERWKKLAQMALESHRRKNDMETLCSFPKEDGSEDNKLHQGNNNMNTAQIKEEEENRTDLEGLKRNNVYLEECSADQIDTIIRWRFFIKKTSSKSI